MNAISNKRMNLLHLREVKDYDEELIKKKKKWFSLNFDQWRP